LKKPQSSTTVAMQTTNVPMSCVEMITPPTSTVELGNGLSNALTSAPQIHPASPLIAMSSPIVTITIVSGDAFSTGRMTTRSIPTPAMNAIASVMRNAGQ
jgi:hypothetical protein